MLNANANINQSDKGGWTAVMCAAENGHSETVQILLNANANTKQSTMYGQTALMLAAQNGHSETVQILLNANPNINQSDKGDRTAVMLAAQNGHSETVQILLNANADINQSHESGWTALMLAAQNGHSETVQVLLNANANINQSHESGWTALMYAAQYGHSETVQVLLNANANINQSTMYYGQTALMYAAENGHSETVQVLLDANADINQANNHGKTALMWGAECAHNQVVSILLQHGANLDHLNNEGNNALTVADQKKHIHTAQLLKDAINFKNLISDVVDKFATFLPPRKQLQVSTDGLTFTKLNCFKILFSRMTAILSCVVSPIQKQSFVSNFAMALLKLNGTMLPGTFDQFIMQNSPTFLTGVGAGQVLGGKTLPNELVNKIFRYLPKNASLDLFRSGLYAGEKRATDTAEQINHNYNIATPAADDIENSPAIACSSTSVPERARRKRERAHALLCKSKKRQRGKKSNRPTF